MMTAFIVRKTFIIAVKHFIVSGHVFLLREIIKIVIKVLGTIGHLLYYVITFFIVFFIT